MDPSNAGRILISNTRTDLRLADRAWVAQTYQSRTKGLLNIRELESGLGLLIPRCTAIHTFFMKMRIDVVFVDRTFHVVRLFPAAPAFRVFWGGWKARAVIELPPGTIQRSGTQLGDLLACHPELS
jgi:uncharacterized membrane protein (UPF0127 family)